MTLTLSQGQLGLGDLNNRDEPVHIESISSFTATSVNCGGLHSVIIVEDPRLLAARESGASPPLPSWSCAFVFGSNQAGQLGIGAHAPCMRPASGSFDQVSVAALARSLTSPMLRASSNELDFKDVCLVACTNGASDKRHTDVQCHPRPLLIPPELPASNVMRAVAAASGSQHTLIVLDRGGVLAFGDGEYGVLGDGAMNGSAKPLLMSKMDVHHVESLTCGFMHSLAVVDPPFTAREIVADAQEHTSSKHRQRRENLASLVSVAVEQDLSMDASTLAESFVDAYVRATHNKQKAAILVSGISGVGKSAIINSVFGRQIAHVGAGRPVTKHFMVYEPEDKPVTVYDSRGLEYGHHEEFIEETQRFLFDHSLAKKGEPADIIHVVWYVLDASQARLQGFEIDLCKAVFGHYPIIFVLNKADLVSAADVRSLRRVIEEAEMPNLRGIVETVTTDVGYRDVNQAADSKAVAVSRRNVAVLSYCTACYSDDVVYRRKKHLLRCEACERTYDTLQPIGLKELVDMTQDLLPEAARQSFITAQAMSDSARREESTKLLRGALPRLQSARTTREVLAISAELITTLSIVWDFGAHAK